MIDGPSSQAENGERSNGKGDNKRKAESGMAPQQSGLAKKAAVAAAGSAAPIAKARPGQLPGYVVDAAEWSD